MTLFDPHDPRPVQFVGIAGAGMSALAELLARRGIAVSGCDASPGRNEALVALGISVEPLPSRVGRATQNNPEAHLGSWHDTETNHVIYDASQVEKSRPKAVSLGKQRGEDAVWDFKNNSEIRLK